MSDPLIGMKLGSYQIISALGRGGMARVYKARDLALNRLAAIKVIEPGLSQTGSYSERFRREAQAIAALEHPHIVPVYYFGEQDSLYFLAMKFIEGEDLSSLMERYAIQGEYLPMDDIMRIIDAVGSALDYAHSRGVIHRDVKPSNIMIDQNGHPYLTDFGLALDVSQGTMGEVLGTPHYVAPEQARNSAQVVPQSDLYSLGVMLFEIFTGVVPFDDATPTAIALQHILNEPPAPRALNPALAPAIEMVILKAMVKNPDERYQTGEALAEALRSAVDHARGIDDDLAATLPPLPPGVVLPPPRHPSLQSVAVKVQESLDERSAFLTQPAPQPEIQPESLGPQPVRSIPPGPVTLPGRRRPAWLPWMIAGLAVLGIVVVVSAVLLGGRDTSGVPSVAELSTPTDLPAMIETALLPTTEVPIVPSLTPVVISDTLAPTSLPATPTALPTEVVFCLPPSRQPCQRPSPCPAQRPRFRDRHQFLTAGCP